MELHSLNSPITENYSTFLLLSLRVTMVKVVLLATRTPGPGRTQTRSHCWGSSRRTGRGLSGFAKNTTVLGLMEDDSPNSKGRRVLGRAEARGDCRAHHPRTRKEGLLTEDPPVITRDLTVLSWKEQLHRVGMTPLHGT